MSKFLWNRIQRLEGQQNLVFVAEYPHWHRVHVYVDTTSYGLTSKDICIKVSCWRAEGLQARYAEEGEVCVLATYTEADPNYQSIREKVDASFLYVIQKESNLKAFLLGFQTEALAWSEGFLVSPMELLVDQV